MKKELIIEKLINENKLQLPDEEAERIMYWTVVNELKENGYNQYEISNFSKKTYESKHNTNCWKQKQYIGLGTSAHSYLNKKRYSNTNNIEEYIKNIQENNISKNITISRRANRRINNERIYATRTKNDTRNKHK